MNLDARGIAQEVSQYYESRLNPYQPHAVNVHTVLQGPVIALTHHVLLLGSPLPESQNGNVDDDVNELHHRGEEEKKCCGEEEEKENNHGASNELLVKRVLEAYEKESKDDERDVLLSLGRRNKARFEAFMLGVELAVPSTKEQPTTLSLTSSSSSSSSSASSSSPPSPSSSPPGLSKNIKNKNKKQDDSNNNNALIPQKKKENKHSNANNNKNKKNAFETSPVLTSLNHHGKALLRSVSGEPLLNKTRKHKQPQIGTTELQVRLELYVRSLLRVRSLQQDCVVAHEPTKAVKARAQMIVASFVSAVGCVRSMSPVLTRLLAVLTKELLAVETIGEGLVQLIRRLVNEYEHSISFASLAFLSSPEASAETRLTPMIVRYIRYLQSDWKSHEQSCELEHMLATCLDGEMRLFLKTVEFQSIGHLLEVCQGFRSSLNNIELEPTSLLNSTCSGSSTSSCSTLDLCNNPEAVRQAIRDLQREVITVNGHVLPPVTSRQDLIELLSQSLNSRSLTASNNSDGRPNTLVVPEIQKKKNSTGKNNKNNAHHNDSHDNISSQEGDDDDDDAQDKIKSRRKGESPPGLKRRASFHLSTVDLLTRRLLIAASRTGTGGDAYFIVRDLFGGDEVEVVPAKVLPHHVRASRIGSIEIQVRLASVTIKCHGSFDIYPKSLVGCCEPLIQLHTTSSETIFLQELRSCDSSLSDDGKHCLEDDHCSAGMENLVLQEKTTNRTGKRVLSIRPALYEKIQVWNTPS